jgi:sec-independent protein translocase protein TatB
MSGIGFSELIILFLIGLIVLGPERLPRVANQIGGWLGQARRMTRVMKRQLEEELNLEKELSINPSPSVSKPSYVKPASDTNKFDDTYSPAHAEDEPGTGIGDTPSSAPAGDEPETGIDGATDDDEDAAKAAADQKALQEDIDSALPPSASGKDTKPA